MEVVAWKWEVRNCSGHMACLHSNVNFPRVYDKGNGRPTMDAADLANWVAAFDYRRL